MAALRCSLCNIDFPSDVGECPADPLHELWVVDGMHDPDWEQKVDSILDKIEPFYYPIPNAEVPLILVDGHAFVHKDNLKKAGYRHVNTGSVVMVNGLYFEVGGSIFVDSDAESWWLEPIPELQIDHPVMTEWEYEQLEVQRGRR